jgi:hypothetical protein
MIVTLYSYLSKAQERLVSVIYSAYNLRLIMICTVYHRLRTKLSFRGDSIEILSSS